MNHRLQEIAHKFYIRGASVPQIVELLGGQVTRGALYRWRKRYDWERDRILTQDRMKALRTNFNSLTYLVTRMRRAGSASDLINAKDELAQARRELKEQENYLASADQELEAYLFESMTSAEREEYLERVALTRAIQVGSGAVVNAYVNLKKSKRDILKETVLVFDDFFEYLAEADPEFLTAVTKHHWRPFVTHIVTKYRKAGVDINSDRLDELTQEMKS